MSSRTRTPIRRQPETGTLTLNDAHPRFHAQEEWRLTPVAAIGFPEPGGYGHTELMALIAPVVANRSGGLSVPEAQVMIVAVPVDAVSELEGRGLAFPVPVFRSTALDVLVAVGTDAATLVSLLQAPDAIRAFAAWVRGRCERSGDSIELSARSGGRQVHLKVDGSIDVAVVADFIASALKDEGSQG